MLNRPHSSPMSMSSLPLASSPSSSWRKQLYGVALLLCMVSAAYLYYRMQVVNNELQLTNSVSSVESVAAKSASIWTETSTEEQIKTISSDDSSSPAISGDSSNPASTESENGSETEISEENKGAAAAGAAAGAAQENEKEEGGEVAEQPSPVATETKEELQEEEVANTLQTPYTWELLLSLRQQEQEHPSGFLAPRISDVFFEPMHLRPIANPTSVRIFLVGDSLTQGVGYPQNAPGFTHPYQLGFEAIWKKVYPNISLSIVADALSGECVLSSCRQKSIRERVETHLSTDEEGFDIVVMLGGTNDLSIHRGQEAQLARAIFQTHQRILQGTKLADGSVKVPRTTMLTLPEISSHFGTPADKERLTLNRQLRTWCSGKAVQQMEEIVPPEEGTCLLVDAGELMPRKKLDEDSFAKLWSDSVHPSEIGYDFMGEIIFRHVEHYFKFD